MFSLAPQRLRGLAAVAFVALAAFQLARLARTTLGPEVYDEDFRQEYCLARALAAGEPLYRPLPEMVARYIGPGGTVLPTSPNHPPPAALLALPFAAVRYETAARAWLLLQLVALVWTMRALAAEFGWSPATGWIASAAALVWSPVALDLRFGNLYVVLLALLVGSWRAWRHDRAWRAGALLGLGTALKLVPGYLILYLVLRREWRAVGAAAAVCGGLALGVTLWAGPAIWSDFAGSVGQSMTIYQQQCFNVSLYGSLHRLTHGIADVAPLWPGVGDGWIALAEGVVLAVPPVLAVRRLFPPRYASSDLDWALFVTACTLATPLAWHYTFTLLLLPIAVLANRAAGAGGLRPVHALAFLGLAVPLEVLTVMAQGLAGLFGASPDGLVSGIAGLPYAVPTCAGLVGFGATALARLRATPPATPVLGATRTPDLRPA